MPELNSLIDKARGLSPADLLLKNVRLVNVLAGEIHAADVAIADGVFLGWGDYQARKVIDAGGRYLVPGLIDGHIHIESSQLRPAEFARLAAAHGTAVVIADPHEIANVMGRAGIEFMLSATAGLPLSFYFMVPACVPATTMETSGADLDSQAISDLLRKHQGRLLGLGEVMNFPAVLAHEDETMAKIAAGGHLIDGHAPGLGGLDLNAYVLAGPGSDHEAVSAAEAREKLRAGMCLMIREGSREHNLDALLPVVNSHNSSNCMLVSDDRHVLDLLQRGHLDYSIRRAVAAGLAPLTAIQMATINPARYFGLRGRGAIAPGYRADAVLLDDLENFVIDRVLLAGKEPLADDFISSGITLPTNTVKLGALSNDAFVVPAAGKNLLVIGIVPGQLVTRKLVLPARVEKGLALADPDRDLLKLAVLERHQGSGRIGLGFVHGLGLKSGALAGSVAHDSHNLIVAGTNDEDMRIAVRQVAEMGGGLVLADQGRVVERLPLPIAGLMSAEKGETTAAALKKLQAAAASRGAANDPFMILSFLALPVIPALKLTDRGLVDGERFCLVSLWCD